MTLPSSPPLSVRAIAAELGESSVGFSISSSTARTLAGVASGPIGMHDFYGKSTDMPISAVTITSQLWTGSALAQDVGQTVTFSGGVGPFTYVWNYALHAGSGGSIDGSIGQGTPAFELDLNTVTRGQACTADVNVTVSDGTGSATSATVQWAYQSG